MKRKILAQLVYIFVRLLVFTYRFKHIEREKLSDIRSNSPYNNFIFGIWHQNLLSGIFAQTGEQFAVIVSSSKDGELVSTTCEKLGHKVARGSSNRGGKEAMYNLISLLKQKYPGAITVDGPKGPAHEPKKGIFEIAKTLDIPVVPYLALPENYWTIEKSWDKFRVPKPFSKIYVAYGAPIYVSQQDKDNAYSNASNTLKTSLNLLEQSVRERFF